MEKRTEDEKWRGAEELKDAIAHMTDAEKTECIQKGLPIRYTLPFIRDQERLLTAQSDKIRSKSDRKPVDLLISREIKLQFFVEVFAHQYTTIIQRKAKLDANVVILQEIAKLSAELRGNDKRCNNLKQFYHEEKSKNTDSLNDRISRYVFYERLDETQKAFEKQHDFSSRGGELEKYPGTLDTQFFSLLKELPLKRDQDEATAHFYDVIHKALEQSGKTLNDFFSLYESVFPDDHFEEHPSKY